MIDEVEKASFGASGKCGDNGTFLYDCNKRIGCITVATAAIMSIDPLSPGEFRTMSCHNRSPSVSLGDLSLRATYRWAVTPVALLKSILTNSQPAH